ncbi:MAG: hypothetical protein WA660_01530 [Candidatus Acidiferrales bacterium]
METKPNTAAPFIVLCIGLIGLFNLTQRPRFEMYRTVDVLQLIASGMSFGVALILLMIRFRGQVKA